MATAMSIAFIANTNDLLLTGLKSDQEGAFLNALEPSVVIKDVAGQEVAGSTWPLLMTYVPESDGNYILGLSHNLQFVVGTKYVALVTVDASDTGGERYAHWEFPFTAQTRTGLK